MPRLGLHRAECDQVGVFFHGLFIFTVTVPAIIFFVHFAQAVFVRISCDQGCAAYIHVVCPGNMYDDVHVTFCTTHLEADLHGGSEYVSGCIQEVGMPQLCFAVWLASLCVLQMLATYGTVASFHPVLEPSVLLLEHSNSGAAVPKMQLLKGEQHHWMSAAGSSW